MMDEDVLLTSPKPNTERSRVRKFRSLRQEWSGWLFILPGFLALTIFVFIPAGYVIFLSMVHWNLLSANPKFVGLANYVHLAQSSDFRQALSNTLLFGLGLIVIILPLGLLLALFLDLGLRGTRLYRTFIFGPYVLPLVGSGLVWTLIYNPDFGLANHLLQWFHIHGPNWLGAKGFSLLAVLIMTVWQYLGFYMLIFLGGLQNVSAELKEAAAIDGANEKQIFSHVTLPALSPSIFFALIVCTIQAFQTFDQVYVMTGGGPDGATTTLVYYIYTEGFQMYDIGIATAAATVLLLLLVGLTWLQFYIGRRLEVN